MNCEFVINKADLPLTKIILLSLIEEKYCLQLDYKEDKVYMIDKQGDKILVEVNNLEDLRDELPNKVQVLLFKGEVKNTNSNKNQIEKMIKDLDFPDPRDHNELGDSLLIITQKISEKQAEPEPKVDNKNQAQPIDYSLEIDAFNRLLNYIANSQYPDSVEFDKKMINKPYASSYYQALKVANQCKQYVSDISEKFKKLSAYTTELEKQKLNLESALKTGGKPQGMSNDLQTTMNKCRERFIPDVYNEFYAPVSNNVSRELEQFTNFYNDIVFQVKNNLLGELKSLNDFFDYNQGIMRMILESQGYKKQGQNLMKVDIAKMEGKEIKAKTEVVSILLQNVYNLLD